MSDTPINNVSPQSDSNEQHVSDDGAAVTINDIDNLKMLTDSRWIEIASGDIESHIEDDEYSLNALGKKHGTYYRDIIFALIQIRLPEEEAKRDWKEMLKHKFIMSQKLDRNVGIHVAALDYYTNFKRKIVSPKIVDAHDYADTASRAMTDELTKAYNRHFFEEEFRDLFTEAQETLQCFSLVMIDLDYFKKYNDVNGHIQGDLALIQTVRILHAVCSAEDTVARFGGEEFVILLPKQLKDAAIATAENIREAIYDYRFVNESHQPLGRLTASLGVTTWRPALRSTVTMLQEADDALYMAKKNGRNQVQFFKPETTV
jgi:diguanylate cyclase (GGDEF)-like protein